MVQSVHHMLYTTCGNPGSTSTRQTQTGALPSWGRGLIYLHYAKIYSGEGKRKLLFAWSRLLPMAQWWVADAPALCSSFGASVLNPAYNAQAELADGLRSFFSTNLLWSASSSSPHHHRRRRCHHQHHVNIVKYPEYTTILKLFLKSRLFSRLTNNRVISTSSV